MPALIFNKCCGSIPLKTGCFILGFINLLGLAIMIILIIVQAVEQVAEYTEQRAFIPIALTGFIMHLILWLLALVFDVLFLIGVHQNKPGYVNASLIYYITFLVNNIVRCISTLPMFAVMHSARQITRAGKLMIVFTALTSVMILFHVVFLLVGRSLYYQMKQKSSKGTITLSAV